MWGDDIAAINWALHFLFPIVISHVETSTNVVYEYHFESYIKSFGLLMGGKVLLELSRMVLAVVI